ncbi:MAG: biotin/lipoyl-containing protein, partial [Actinomycetota bacterium]
MSDAQHSVVSPLIGTVARILVATGDEVHAGDEVVIIESMKMEHPVTAGSEGVVSAVGVAEGETVAAGQVLLSVAPGVVAPTATAGDGGPADTGERADLARWRERRDLTLDAARPDAVARRAAKGQRTARANIADLVDEGSFIEYGTFAIAAQRRRRDLARSARSPVSAGPPSPAAAGGGTIPGATESRT